MSYAGIIAQLNNVRVHPNADRLKLATVNGNQVVVGLEQRDGDWGIFFPPDGQLSVEYAKANDLIRRKNPETGKYEGGMFDENRRVRAQKFRGEKSEGFWIPTTSLAFCTRETSFSMEIGQEVTEINGVPICNKYETPATKRAQHGNNARKQTRGSTLMFKRNFDYERFRDIADNLPDGALITITEKLHGTSHRVGSVLEQEETKGWKSRVGKLFGFDTSKSRWVTLHGSRNVILDSDMSDLYYNDNFRGIATKPLENNLRKGETVYLEIVGYLQNGNTIMPGHQIDKLKDLEMTKMYGEYIVYVYGQKRGECKAYIYRITVTDIDGNTVELSDSQMRTRASELGMDCVPLLDKFILNHTIDLRATCEYYADGVSTLDNSHIREGIVIRIEHPNMNTFAKLKNFNFLQMESNQKDDDTIVDTEEAS